VDMVAGTVADMAAGTVEAVTGMAAAVFIASPTQLA
jgi:hypothetical protein